jgi:hypothetical protein
MPNRSRGLDLQDLEYSKDQLKVGRLQVDLWALLMIAILLLAACAALIAARNLASPQPAVPTSLHEPSALRTQDRLTLQGQSSRNGRPT